MLTLWTTHMLLDDHFARYSYSCLLGLDDPYRRMGVKFLVHHQLPPCPRVIQSIVKFITILWTCLYIWLLNVVPHVMTSLVTSHVNLPVRGICHVSFSDWLCHFRCQNLLPINNRNPLIPFTFLKFSPLTFLI